MEHLLPSGLGHESSQPHQYSTLPSTTDEPTSSPSTRIPYRRQKSWVSPTLQEEHVAPEDEEVAEADKSQDDIQGHGLGLSNVPEQDASSSTIRRVPVGSRTHPSANIAPETSRSFEVFSQTTTAQNTGDAHVGGGWSSPQSSRYSLKEPAFQYTPSNVDLLPHDHGVDGCPTAGDLLKSQWTWFTTMVVVLTVYSTLFSGMFLGLAIAQPRWGHRIGTRGALSYDTATLLSALFSKTVELSFVTTVVATLGQILSKRAFQRGGKGNRGISIAEMNMRLWIMQPGTLVTHWVGAKHAVVTLLGISALVATLASTFYTTACESLVSPKLKFGRNETFDMYGEVTASFANGDYLADTCQTPILSAEDPLSYGTTCLQIDYAGNGFRNLDSWLSMWSKRPSSNQAMEVLKELARPPPIGILFENTTIQGQWITPSGENMTADSARYGRLVQNVTMVMPHANIFHAARARKNRILQPEDLHGAGEYYLKAAVATPGLNVLCVGASEDELRPLISADAATAEQPAAWPNTSGRLNALFGWSPERSANLDSTVGAAVVPWFSKLPKEYNTVVNTSSPGVGWGRTSVYLLANPPNTTVTSDYLLCGMRSFLYSNCSTGYHVAESGGQLSVHCDNDPENWKSYGNTAKPDEEPYPTVVDQPDWVNVGGEWIRAVALSQGALDSDASAARLVTQLIPPYSNDTGAELSPIRPTIAEALAVLAGYTLLLSSDVAPFVHYWDYASTALESPATANFSAILSYKDYASGGDARWKGVFFIVLIAVFAQNCFCLLYLMWHFCHYGEVTDYTEPQNLFALAVNSPPSAMLAGACGGGPSGEMLRKRWCVDMSRPGLGTSPHPTSESPYNHNLSHDNTNSGTSHPHFYVHYPDDDKLELSGYTSSAQPSPSTRRFPRLTGSSPLKKVSWSADLNLTTMKRRSKMARLKSMQDLTGQGGESPAVDQYLMLSRQR